MSSVLGGREISRSLCQLIRILEVYVEVLLGSVTNSVQMVQMISQGCNLLGEWWTEHTFQGQGRM